MYFLLLHTIPWGELRARPRGADGRGGAEWGRQVYAAQHDLGCAEALPRDSSIQGQTRQWSAALSGRGGRNLYGARGPEGLSQADRPGEFGIGLL
jgi:hypothetical protein